jgi:oligopeptide transport system substrate-binding protein
MWQAVNVETELANSEMMVVSQDLRSGRFELARSAWYAAYNDPIAFLQLFESDKTDVNFSGYANPAYDAILADAAAMKNLAARALVLRDAEALAMTDHPVIPIYYYVGKRLVSPVVKGWIDNPRSVNRARHLWIEQN